MVGHSVKPKMSLSINIQNRENDCCVYIIIIISLSNEFNKKISIILYFPKREAKNNIIVVTIFVISLHGFSAPCSY